MKVSELSDALDAMDPSTEAYIQNITVHNEPSRRAEMDMTIRFVAKKIPRRAVDGLLHAGQIKAALALR